MSSKAKLILLLTALAMFAIATLVLIVFYADFVHERVWIPLIRSAYVAKHYLDQLHGLVLWLIPVGLFTIPLVRALLRVLTQQEASLPGGFNDWPIIPQAGELEALAQQLGRSSHSRFARARISRNLKELAVRMIAGREGVSVEHARVLLEGGCWRSNAAVHTLLMPRRHYAGKQSQQEFAQSLEQTIAFLEAYYKEA